MKRICITTALLVGTALLAPVASEAAKGFSLGVAASEVTPTSARLWARADRPGRVFLRVNSCRGRGALRRARARRRDNLTVQKVIKPLRPATRYCYRFRMRKRLRARGRSHRRRYGRVTAVSDRGTFVTPPAPGAGKIIRFGFSGDTDAQRAPGASRPYYNDFEVYRRMAEERNDFNINLGDTIYSDSEVPHVWPGVPDALTTSQKWAKYRLNLALPNLQLLRSGGVTYSHWDDHEFINDFTRYERQYDDGNAVSGNERVRPYDPVQLYRDGVRAFRDYMPVTYSRDDGIYRTFRWGKNLEIFMLDERSFRSAKASAGHACDNPNSGSPDQAPTADGLLVRREFGLVLSGVRGPVTQRCKDTLNDPRRTFLGARQLARFKQEIKASDATWKVIVNELPIQVYYALPYDRWEGYVHEREALVRWLKDNVKNVVFLATDVHANLVNDVWVHGLERGGTVERSGIPEFVTGPVATMTFNKEINGTVGSDAVGPAVNTTVFKAPPPQGVGMRCAQIDTYSYGEVTASSTRLTIALKDAGANPVLDFPLRSPCGPYTLEAK